jgi:sulfate transport system permease protein
LGLGLATAYLSLIVLIPMAAVVWRATNGGADAWDTLTSPQAQSALRLTIGLALVVALINAVMGTLIAWVLVRDRFRGRGMVDALIDLPFALPTIVAGLILLALYGPRGPLGVNVAYTRIGIVLALLFVTLPFVVRTVQPVLREADREMEDAAASLGAGPVTVFRRIVLPTLLPAILSGTGLAFSRALGEFGAVILIAGNIPFHTQLASVLIFAEIEGDNAAGAAAVSVALLVLSLAVLIVFGLLERRSARRG